MNVKRTEEVEKIRKNLELKLTVRTHRCTWCDLIKEGKETRKRKAETGQKETLWRTRPLSIKKDD